MLKEIMDLNAEISQCRSHKELRVCADKLGDIADRFCRLDCNERDVRTKEAINLSLKAVRLQCSVLDMMNVK